MEIGLVCFFIRKKGMDERIGFIGIVLEDLAQAEKVNRVIGEYHDMVNGRIGVPDHERKQGVIGLVVRGDVNRLGSLTGKLGNLPGVTVKSAVTKKTTSTENKE